MSGGEGTHHPATMVFSVSVASLLSGAQTVSQNASFFNLLHINFLATQMRKVASTRNGVSGPEASVWDQRS